MTADTPAVTAPSPRELSVPLAVLAATFLFNLGQGVLRPAMPLYLQRSFTANYRMVTLIPVVFGVGKWVASLPSGYLMDRLGRRLLMSFGLLLIAAIDVLSIATADYRVFLALRAVGGAGWAMFATVATTITVGVRASERRGRAVSLLLMSETLGCYSGARQEAGCIRGSEPRALADAVDLAAPFLCGAGMLLVVAWLCHRQAATRPAAP